MNIPAKLTTLSINVAHIIILCFTLCVALCIRVYVYSSSDKRSSSNGTRLICKTLSSTCVLEVEVAVSFAASLLLLLVVVVVV